MADFRITITPDGGDVDRLAAAILAEHGENFDADRGDFTTTVEGGKLFVDVKEVGGGDIDALADDLMTMTGVEDVAVAQKVGGNYFGRDEGDDVIEERL